MAEQATTLMKSRRRITAPKAQKHAENRLITSGIRDRRNGGQRSICAAKILNRQMSALGQKRTSEYVQAMSALPPKADIEASMSRQDDFQNCCGSEAPPSNFYTRLRLPSPSRVSFAKRCDFAFYFDDDTTIDSTARRPSGYCRNAVL
jgi:hypothetical protein